MFAVVPQKSILLKARKLSGRCKIEGLDISIETDRGEKRSGVSEDGKKWETLMKDPYGYIKGTLGVDGDHIDLFLGPVAQAIRNGNTKESIKDVWVVHQKNPNTGKYDEDKVMFGYRSKDEAIRAYKAHYDEPEKFFGPVTEMSLEAFKEKIKGSRENPKRLGQGKIEKSKSFVLLGLSK